MFALVYTNMIITSININNFRLYENVSISFDKELSVIIGKNGTGKSGILDAVSLALGSYLAGFDGISGNGISQDDVRLKTFQSGSSIEAQKQYPVEIQAEALVEDAEGKFRTITWKRILAREGGRTQTTYAKPITEYAAGLQAKIRRQNRDLILPIIAYYGTGRLYRHKQHKKTSDTAKVKFNRALGYDSCLEAASDDKSFWQWFKRMSDIEFQGHKEVPELEAVKRAMGKCYIGRSGKDGSSESQMPSFEYMADSGEFEIVYYNNNEKVRLPFRMLSDGVRVTVNMVADIAYRMARLNPDLLERITDETPGIVLIDEIDMHLHPAWQKRILDDLRYIFPKVQFIVTTHSPSVLANIESQNNILCLSGQSVYSPEVKTYGRDTDNLLETLMDTEVQPDAVMELKREFYNSSDNDDRENAEKYLIKLGDLLGTGHPEYIKAKIAYDLEFEIENNLGTHCE